MGVITGATKLLGVMGYPVEHSLSPVMHNAILASLSRNTGQGLDYVYVAFPVLPAALAAAVAGFAAIGLRGFNVTIPHKQAILPLLDQVSAIAQAVGAVNTVWRTEQGWSGTNTDVQGFLAPLQEQRDWQQTTALVLGSGGAARAVVAGCGQLGCTAIRVVGRDRLKLKQFQQSWHPALSSLSGSTVALGTSGTSFPTHLHVHTWADLPELLPQADLLVNTTPVGMHPQVDQSPLSDRDVDQLPKQAIVYDLIYTPNPTRLLQQVQARDLTAIDGLEMLVQQGAAALEIWLNQPIPVDVMRQAAQQYLADRSSTKTYQDDPERLKV